MFHLVVFLTLYLVLALFGCSGVFSLKHKIKWVWLWNIYNCQYFCIWLFISIFMILGDENKPWWWSWNNCKINKKMEEWWGDKMMKLILDMRWLCSVLCWFFKVRLFLQLLSNSGSAVNIENWMYSLAVHPWHDLTTSVEAQIKCVESKWTMFCEESKQQHLFKFTDNTHGNSAIITRLFANSVLQKIANNGLHKIFRVLWEIANNRYQNFGRSHLV